MSTYLLFFKVIILIYFVVLLYLDIIAKKSSKKLTKKSVSTLLQKESKKLNLKNKQILYEFTSKWNSNSQFIDGVYHIHFGKFAKECTVKHEVFHIYKGDCDNHGRGLLNWLRIMILWIFLFEFRAKLYTAFDIKL